MDGLIFIAVTDVANLHYFYAILDTTFPILIKVTRICNTSLQTLRGSKMSFYDVRVSLQSSIVSLHNSSSQGEFPQLLAFHSDADPAPVSCPVQSFRRAAHLQ
jgi:hypothetical protein